MKDWETKKRILLFAKKTVGISEEELILCLLKKWHSINYHHFLEHKTVKEPGHYVTECPKCNYGSGIILDSSYNNKFNITKWMCRKCLKIWTEKKPRDNK